MLTTYFSPMRVLFLYLYLPVCARMRMFTLMLETYKRIWSTCQKILLRFLYAYEYAYAICEKNVTGAEYSLKKNLSDFF